MIDLTLALCSPLSLQTLTIFPSTADVKNPPFHISCRLSLSERPVLVLREIVLRVRLAWVNEAVISFYDLNYLAALVEVIQLVTVRILVIP